MDTPQEVCGSEVGSRARVLVMEDEVNVARALEMVLKEEGYEVDVAMTGASALDRLNWKDFDLLIADLRLPDINGMDVIKKVRQEQPSTDVVVITGYSTVASAVEAMKLGAVDYLAKPFTEDELKNIIASTLKKREATSTGKGRPDQKGMQVGALIPRHAVLGVLNRATQDEQSWRNIMENGTVALEDYRLPPEAKAAIMSGDLIWVRDITGELTQNGEYAIGEIIAVLKSE
ncbi:MAG: response regulator [Syntrophobacteraceae bacterium]